MCHHQAARHHAAEYEYLIPVEDAEQLLQICRKPLVEKTRYSVNHDAHVWAIDVFGGNNTGLVLAEIELSKSDEAFARPSWVGREVTNDPRYHNSNLGIAPIPDHLDRSVA